MTVGELVEKLQALDQSKRIVVRGYETGFDDLGLIISDRAHVDANFDPESGLKNKWYNGRHANILLDYNEQLIGAGPDCHIEDVYVILED